MASEIDVCNLALSHLGDDAYVSSIDPPEGSAQAAHCARFLPLALGQLIESHPWRFALARKRLAQVTSTIEHWEYAYGLPSDMLRPVALLPDGASDDHDGVSYMIEGTTLYSNEPDAVLRYIKSGVAVSTLPPSVASALSWLLAAFLSGPVTKEPKLREYCFRMYEATRRQAAVLDANSAHDPLTHTVGWIGARE